MGNANMHGICKHKLFELKDNGLVAETLKINDERTLKKSDARKNILFIEDALDPD